MALAAVVLEPTMLASPCKPHIRMPMVAMAEEASTPPDDSIVTDRPTDSASPELVPRKTLQIEMGYKFSRLDSESGRTDTQEAPDLLARFGISDKVELRLTATGWTFRNIVQTWLVRTARRDSIG